MAQWVKVFAAKLKDVSSILRTHMMVEGGHDFPEVILCPLCTQAERQMQYKVKHPKEMFEK